MESMAEINTINRVKETTYSGNCPSHKYMMYGVSIMIGRESRNIKKKENLELLNTKLNIFSKSPWA